MVKRQDGASDKEWARRARPLYMSLCWLAKSLRRGLVEADSMADEYQALRDIEKESGHLTEEIRGLPRPDSPAARQAEKRLRSAHRKLSDVMKNGANFYVDLFGGPGERVTYDAISGKVAEARRGLKALYEDKIGTAVKDLEAMASHLEAL